MGVQEFKSVVQEKLETLQAERLAVRTKLEQIDRLLEAISIVLEAEEHYSTAQPVTVKWERGDRAKTIELVKEIVMASGTAGILPREVRVKLEKTGIHPGPQVVTNSLSRWKKRDYTVEIGGRHYWKEYLSDIELQKVRPRKRRHPTRRTWETPTESL
jgi:hypothetical protein